MTCIHGHAYATLQTRGRSIRGLGITVEENKEKQRAVADNGMVTVPAGVTPANAAWASVASAGALAKWMTNLSSFGAPAVRVMVMSLEPDGSMKPNTGEIRYSLLFDDLIYKFRGCSRVLPVKFTLKMSLSAPPLTSLKYENRKTRIAYHGIRLERVARRALIEKQKTMADDNVSFTDQGTSHGDDKKRGANSSAMLDILGQMEKKKNPTKKKGKKATKGKKKEKKGKTKRVRKVDKFESQNFLYRVEGSLFCAGIIIALIMLLVFIIMGIIFGVRTNGNMVSYMPPLWGAEDDTKDESGDVE